MKPVRGYIALFVASTSSVTACAPVELRPPAPPTKDVPALPVGLGPVPPGKQRVLLDAPGEKASVSEVTSDVTGLRGRGDTGSSEAERPTCITPCALDLSEGLHRISFVSVSNWRRGSSVDVQVQGDPMVIRHVMEETRTPHPSVRIVTDWTAGLGYLGILAGSSIGVVGLVSSATSSGRNGGGLEVVGLATLGAGAAVVLVSELVFYLFGRDVHSPPVTTQWAIPGATFAPVPPAVSASTPATAFARQPSALFTF